MEFILGFLIGFILPFPTYVSMRYYIKQLDDEILELSQKLNEKEI